MQMDRGGPTPAKRPRLRAYEQYCITVCCSKASAHLQQRRCTYHAGRWEQLREQAAAWGGGTSRSLAAVWVYPILNRFGMWSGLWIM